MSEPLKVSDPSQKWKILLALVVSVAVVFLLVRIDGKKGGGLLGGGEIGLSADTTSTISTLGVSSTVTGIARGSEQWFCNTGTNVAYVALGTIATTSLEHPRGLLVPTSTQPCIGPLHWFGTTTAVTKTGTTTLLFMDMR